MSHQAQNPNPQPFEVSLQPTDAIKEVEGDLALALCYMRHAEKLTARLSERETHEYCNIAFAVQCQLEVWRTKHSL